MKIEISTYNPKVKKRNSIKMDMDFSLSFLNRFSDKRKEDFYREFSTLLRAGVDFNQALEI